MARRVARPRIPNPMKQRPRHSSKEIVRRLRSYGLGYNQAVIAYRATHKAMREMLLEGLQVNLWNLGTLTFRFRKGRTIPNPGPKFFAPRVQGDSYSVTFRPGFQFREDFKRLKVVPRDPGGIYTPRKRKTGPPK